MAEEIIATGRRKCAIAVVKLVKGKGRVFVNGKTLAEFRTDGREQNGKTQLF